MKKLTLIAIIAATLPSLGWSKAGAAWATLPSGAREAGLAGGMGSLAQGLQGSRLNPASLSGLKSLQMHAAHNQWIQGVAQEQGGIAMPVGERMGVALSADWVDMGEVTRYKARTGGGIEAAGSWHPTAGAATLSLGAPLVAGLDYGVSLRGWHQNLDSENSMAASVSGALQYRPTKAWLLSASMLDLGTRLGADELPTSYRLGAAWAMASGPRLGAELAHTPGNPNNPDYSVAVEAPIGSAIVLRGGTLWAAGVSQAVPTAGFSVSVGQWSLDMAYRPTQSLGSTLHVGLSMALN